MEEKRRVHFNEFMIEVHTSIHKLKKTMPMVKSSNKAKPFDPIPPVASLISHTTWLLCFDEFQVRLPEPSPVLVGRKTNSKLSDR